MTERPPRSVLVWLRLLLAMVVGMVVVGGITRLTGSGLSMVEWHPLMGALPPSTEAEWVTVFEQYQRFPQYQQVNDWMGLGDFKRIFFWEYLHRLLGRLVGAVWFVPWAWFVARGRLRGEWLRWTLVAGLLGGLQGLLGWFMVKSGLVDVPAVSHLRLAAHLGLAFVVACWIGWLLLRAMPDDVEAAPRRDIARAAWGTLALVALQTTYGAFMAGTRAGFLYATFPDMNGRLVPSLGHPLHDPTTIHFLHRTLAYVVVLAVGTWWWAARRAATSARQRRAASLAGAVLALQFGLGVATVMLSVPTAVATAHQVGALALLGALLFGAFVFSRNATVPG